MKNYVNYKNLQKVHNLLKFIILFLFLGFLPDKYFTGDNICYQYLFNDNLFWFFIKKIQRKSFLNIICVFLKPFQNKFEKMENQNISTTIFFTDFRL